MDKPLVLKDGVPDYIGHIVQALDSQRRLNDTWTRLFDAYRQQTEELWADNAELRDDLHALANRVETLTRARLTEPAEVAAAIVTDANRGTLREVRGDDAS